MPAALNPSSYAPVMVRRLMTPPREAQQRAPAPRHCVSVTRISGAIVEHSADGSTGRGSLRVIEKSAGGVVLTQVVRDTQGLWEQAQQAMINLANAEAKALAGPKTPPALPPSASSQPGRSGADYAAICTSSMTAIERGQRAVFGPAAQVRIEWIRPFTYDKGDCVGGYVVWVKRPEDKMEWAPSKFFADTGDGRVAVAALVRQYQKDNPDLQWTPTPAR